MSRKKQLPSIARLRGRQFKIYDEFGIRGESAGAWDEIMSTVKGYGTWTSASTPKAVSPFYQLVSMSRILDIIKRIIGK